MVVIQRDDELYHHGTKGQKWGVRRYQNEDGSLTPEGRLRYAGIKDDAGMNVSENLNARKIRESTQALRDFADYNAEIKKLYPEKTSFVKSFKEQFKSSLSTKLADGLATGLGSVAQTQITKLGNSFFKDLSAKATPDKKNEKK